MARWILLIGLCAGWLSSTATYAADEPHDKSGAHDAADPHDAEKPKFPADFQSDLAIWSAVTFLVFLFVLKQLAWKPLINGMNAREAKIRQEIADAEANRAKSEALFREYEAKLAKSQEEVKEILAEARRDADTAKQDILAIADRESQAMRQRAVTDIERARDQALNELFDVVSQNVMQATERVVGRSLTGPDQDRLVREALADLDLRKN